MGDKGEYKGNQAFSGLDLDVVLGFNSDWGVLRSSSSGGRVVLVSGEATKNFDNYLPELKKAMLYLTEEIKQKAQEELENITRFERSFCESLKQ